jgi:hypothetical protein
MTRWNDRFKRGGRSGAGPSDSTTWGLGILPGRRARRVRTLDPPHELGLGAVRALTSHPAVRQPSIGPRPSRLAFDTGKGPRHSFHPPQRTRNPPRLAGELALRNPTRRPACAKRADTRGRPANCTGTDRRPDTRGVVRLGMHCSGHPNSAGRQRSRRARLIEKARFLPSVAPATFEGVWQIPWRGSADPLRMDA